jgi:hypothetical protein
MQMKTEFDKHSNNQQSFRMIFVLLTFPMFRLYIMMESNLGNKNYHINLLFLFTFASVLAKSGFKTIHEIIVPTNKSKP